jgi:hypothetical protein
MSIYTNDLLPAAPSTHCPRYWPKKLGLMPDPFTDLGFFIASVYHDVVYACVSIVFQVPFRDTDWDRAWRKYFANKPNVSPLIVDMFGGNPEESKQQMVHCATAVLAQYLPYLLYFNVIVWFAYGVTRVNAG